MNAKQTDIIGRLHIETTSEEGWVSVNISRRPTGDGLPNFVTLGIYCDLSYARGGFVWGEVDGEVVPVRDNPIGIIYEGHSGADCSISRGEVQDILKGIIEFACNTFDDDDAYDEATTVLSDGNGFACHRLLTNTHDLVLADRMRPIDSMV